MRRDFEVFYAPELAGLCPLAPVTLIRARNLGVVVSADVNGRVTPVPVEHDRIGAPGRVAAGRAAAAGAAGDARHAHREDFRRPWLQRRFFDIEISDCGIRDSQRKLCSG